ncbi:MAG: hypothetical protein NZL93_01780, partial [Chthoniobacterales bacterium]|nr:hypothetical protein [Chthoniobacterales bacterium]
MGKSQIPKEIAEFSKEELEVLARDYPEEFKNLCRQIHDLHLHLARTDINWFIPYVLRWEGKGTPVTQTPVHVALQEHIDKNPYALIWGAVGIGKAQPQFAKVLTPHGWKAIRDIEPGDRVIDPAEIRKSSTVLKKVGPTYTHFYRLRTSTGRSTTATEDHLWVIRISGIKGTRKATTSQILTLMELGLEVSIPVRNGATAWGQEPPTLANAYLVGWMLSRSFDAATLTFQLRSREMVSWLQDGIGTQFSILSQSGKESVRAVPEGATLDYIRAILASKKLTFGPRDQCVPHPLELWPKDRSLLLLGLHHGSIASSHLDHSAYQLEDHLFVPAREGMLSLGWDVETLGPWVSADGLPALQPHEACSTVAYDTLYGNLKRITKWKATPATDAPPLFWDPITELKVEGRHFCECLVLDNPHHLYITDDFIVTHNCVTADTMFIGEDYRPLTALDIYRLVKAGHKPKVLDVDVWTRREEFVTVVACEENGQEPIISIKPKSRVKLEVSANHPVFAEASPGVLLDFVPAESLSLASRIATYYPRCPLNFSWEYFLYGVVLAGAQAYLGRS